MDGESAGDRSGYSVAMSPNGTIVAIGAPENSGNVPLQSDTGYVCVEIQSQSKSWWYCCLELVQRTNWTPTLHPSIIIQRFSIPHPVIIPISKLSSRHFVM